MALRNKKIKIMLSTLAIAGIIISSNSNVTYAYNGLSTKSASIQRNIENKSYKVDNKTTAMKEDGSVSTSEHGQQTVRNCIANETLIEEVDGKIYATYEFTESLYSMLDDIRISIDGVQTSYDKNDDRKYRVELNSIDSEVLIIVKAGPHDTYMKIELELPEKEEVKSYTMSNKTTAMKEDGSISTSEHGQQTVRNCISNETLIEEIGGKIYATYEFTESLYSMLSDIRISVDGVQTSYDKNDDRKYRVELNSIDSEVLIIVKAGPHDTYMKIDLEHIEKEEVKSYTILNKTTALKADGSVSTSEHGQQTVRNSLSESTLIEEIDGKIYATYEFTESLYSMLSDIRISVDGVETSYEKKDDRLYKVELNSIDSEVIITVKAGPHDTYIKVTLGDDDTEADEGNEDLEIVPPTSEDDSANDSELEDGLETDKDEYGDTETDKEENLEEDTDVDKEVSKDNDYSEEKLPQTGSVLGSTELLGTGGLLMSLAAVIKKRNN
ncbi:hypothetical protein EAI30_10795 [Romboutsia ilealis]|uniref:Gram-positive cocci surface proteins LPxTG domain-containing protein n=1 Tax=Romboutsia faecis TaxID=2764597 RepID=A0ABR7JMW8_9FIRM|nr:hypothetical protein [Romboutsia faecis]MBC5996254.1 hypothetical protein [Romboutsia faecis]MRN25104.1 hypothetical protein [Romboutsia ilealis]